MKTETVWRTSWGLAVAVPVLGCAPDPGGEVDLRVTRWDSAGVQVVENGVGADLMTWRVGEAPEVVIGAEGQETGGHLFRVSSATRLSSGAVAVASSGTGEIFVYDESGRTLNVFGRIGEGPGEFTGPVAMVDVIPSDEPGVVVEDLNPRGAKLLFFSWGGEVREDRRLAPGAVPRSGVWSDRTTSASGVSFSLREPLISEPPETGGFFRPPVSLVRFTYGAEDFATVAEYQGRMRFYADVGPRPAMGGGVVHGPRPIPPLFEQGSRLKGGGNPWRAVVADQARAEFDVYDEQGRLVRRVRWEADRRRLSRRDVQVKEEEFLDVGLPSAQDPAIVRRALDAMPSVTMSPTIGSIQVDRIGYVWIQRYRLPTDDTDRWWVFDPEGTLVANAELPMHLEPLEIGDDYVIGRALDEFDVERVEIWTIENR